MIGVSNVWKTYKKNGIKINALQNVDFYVEHGEIFGIIGKQGAGKSTLIRLLSLFEKPTTGGLSISGKSFEKCSRKELQQIRQQIGIVSGNFHLLWSRTVSENITFSLELAGFSQAKISKRLDEVLDIVSLQGREDHYPANLPPHLKLRVSIARALAHEPKLLLCDDPTAHLDFQTSEDILRLLSKINQEFGLTLVIASQQLAPIQRICQQVIILDEGKMVESGSLDQIFMNPKHFVTKRFIREATGEEEAHHLFSQLLGSSPESKVVHLKYGSDTAHLPLISEVVRTFSVNINIIHGKTLQNQKGGNVSVFIQISGAGLNDALTFLTQSGIQLEVIN